MALFLFLLFIVLPILELYVIIQVGHAVGVFPTLGLLLLSAVLGAALLRSQGRSVWRQFNETMAAGKVPAREVFDGAMIILGGALLLTPGFITDLFGIFLLLYPGRALIRSLIKRSAARTATGRPLFFVYDRYSSPRPGAGGAPRRGRAPSRDYDVEGSAREIGDEEHELPPEAGNA
jgi:UPF0716 protein FxsA